ncbi:hypothetical protein HDU97_008711 [Phlyctochytrium planicorne]|nr:hypothetical protein HDU97_008711 [Phlyctochytrium planicorne]
MDVSNRFPDEDHLDADDQQEALDIHLANKKDQQFDMESLNAMLRGMGIAPIGMRDGQHINITDTINAIQVLALELSNAQQSATNDDMLAKFSSDNKILRERVVRLKRESDVLEKAAADARLLAEKHLAKLKEMELRNTSLEAQLRTVKKEMEKLTKASQMAEKRRESGPVPLGLPCNRCVEKLKTSPRCSCASLEINSPSRRLTSPPHSGTSTPRTFSPVRSSTSRTSSEFNSPNRINIAISTKTKAKTQPKQQQQYQQPQQQQQQQPRSMVVTKTPKISSVPPPQPDHDHPVPTVLPSHASSILKQKSSSSSLVKKSNASDIAPQSRPQSALSASYKFQFYDDDGDDDDDEEERIQIFDPTIMAFGSALSESGMGLSTTPFVTSNDATALSRGAEIDSKTAEMFESFLQKQATLINMLVNAPFPTPSGSSGSSRPPSPFPFASLSEQQELLMTQRLKEIEEHRKEVTAAALELAKERQEFQDQKDAFFKDVLSSETKKTLERVDTVLRNL